MRTDNEEAAVKTLLDHYEFYEIGVAVSKNLKYHEIDQLVWYIRQQQGYAEIDKERIKTLHALHTKLLSEKTDNDNK
jgi:hypothetical protein